MPDLQNEISELLGELESSNQETENEAEETGTEQSSPAAESGENGGEAQDQASEAETEETGSEQEQQEKYSEESGENEEQVASEETESKDDIIKRLRAELDNVSQSQPQQEAKSESGSEEESTGSSFDPLMGYEFDNIVEDQNAFSDWASKMFQQAKSQAQEEIFKQLPKTITSYLEQTLNARDRANEFYQQYPELSDNKNYVARLANEVAAESPEWEFKDVLEETATRAKKKLGVEASSKKAEQSAQTKSPGLAKGTKRSPNSEKGKSAAKADNRTETEKQIDDILAM